MLGRDVLDDGFPARLIPTVGIRGQDEQEKRATSSLLAVMHAVRKVHIPDGAVIVERGKAAWRCVVEAKTSGAELKPEQVNFGS